MVGVSQLSLFMVQPALAVVMVLLAVSSAGSHAVGHHTAHYIDIGCERCLLSNNAFRPQ